MKDKKRLFSILKNFIEEHQLWSKFIINWNDKKQYLWRAKHYVETDTFEDYLNVSLKTFDNCHLSFIGFFIYAFAWENTVEGNHFWSQINNEWNDLNYRLKTYELFENENVC